MKLSKDGKMETVQKKEKETCHRKDRNYPNQFPIWCKDEKKGKITLCTNLLITQGGCSFYFGLKDKHGNIY